MLVSHLVRENTGGIQDLMGRPSNYLAMVCAFTVYYFANKRQQSLRGEATQALCGGKAPDVPLEYISKDGEQTEHTTLLELIQETGLPALIDFYQNF